VSAHTSVRVETVLDGDDAQHILTELYDIGPRGAVKPGRKLRVTGLLEYWDGYRGTYLLQASGPLQTLVGRDHLTHTTHVSYHACVPDGYQDLAGRALLPELAAHVRGADALRALAEGRTA